jgi:hypothetical protein
MILEVLGGAADAASRPLSTLLEGTVLWPSDEIGSAAAAGKSVVLMVLAVVLATVSITLAAVWSRRPQADEVECVPAIIDFDDSEKHSSTPRPEMCNMVCDDFGSSCTFASRVFSESDALERVKVNVRTPSEVQQETALTNALLVAASSIAVRTVYLLAISGSVWSALFGAMLGLAVAAAAAMMAGGAIFMLQSSRAEAILENCTAHLCMDQTGNKPIVGCEAMRLPSGVCAYRVDSTDDISVAATHLGTENGREDARVGSGLLLAAGILTTATSLCVTGLRFFVTSE